MSKELLEKAIVEWQLHKPPNYRSDVWQYMYLSTVAPGKVFCAECYAAKNKKFWLKYHSSTSSLQSHLNAKHHIQIEKKDSTIEPNAIEKFLVATESERNVFDRAAVMKEFAKATKELEGDTYPTLSLLYPILFKLDKHLQTPVGEREYSEVICFP